MSKVYVVDIDGTICINGDCSSCKYEGSTPIPERIEKINSLYYEGHTIKYLLLVEWVDIMMMQKKQEINFTILPKCNWIFGDANTTNLS